MARTRDARKEFRALVAHMRRLEKQRTPKKKPKQKRPNLKGIYRKWHRKTEELG